MTPERWEKIGELYHAALELEPAKRAAFLGEACAGDADLRREVESLLAAEEQAGDFIVVPALKDAVETLSIEQPPTRTGREQIGHYSIKSLLGAGGMGEVYLAQDTRLGRRVALKLLPPTAAQDQTARKRLLREARSAAALNHPNIVTIYSVEEVDDSIFIVMEYVEGETLTTLIKRGELGFARLLEVGAQVAEALAAAHSVGLIHRDIKPSNILITPAGQAKLLDFGIAKMTKPLSSEGGGEAATHSHLTAEGAIIGTVAYMSPEQIRGEPLDGRTDIFSLGAVLYEAATGKPPFSGPHVLSIMHEIAVAHPAPPSAIKRDLPPEFDSVIELALAKDRRARQATASELAEGLKKLRSGVYESLSGAAAVSEPARVESRLEAFVGREPELKRMEEILQQAIRGSGQVVFLTGEPGIGKTALAAEFLRRARQRYPDLLCSRGQCAEQYGAGEAYLPVLDALGALLAGPSRERVASALRSQAPTWCLQFPASFVSTDSLGHLRRETIGATKERMLREIGNALGELATGSPFILLLEDLHWADPSSIDLLRHLGQRVGDKRLLVVGTFRPADVELSNNPLKTCKLEMQTHKLCEEIALELLSQEYIVSYLDARFAPHDFPPEFSTLIHHKTEGHPLFVTSLIHFLAERGDITEVNGRWTLTQPPSEIDLETPESVRSMIRKKIEALDDEDLRTLQYASIEGEEFLSTVLASLLKVDDLELEERLDRIDKAHRLIETLGEEELPDSTLATRYRFAHSLYQNVLYGDLVSKRRTRLHRQVGEQLLRHYGDQSPRMAAQLARHFELGRDFGRAVEYFIQAGDNSTRVYANAEATEHYSHALDLVEKLPTEEQAAAYLTTYQKRGNVEIARSRFDQAVDDYTRAIDVARANGRLEMEHAALNGLIMTLFVAHRMDEMARRADEALDLAKRSKDKALQLETRSLVVHKQMCYGELAEAIRTTEETIAEASAIDHKPSLLTALGQRGELHFHQTEYQRAEECLTKAIHLATELGDSFKHLYGLFMLGMVQGNLGRISMALERFNEMKRIAERNGDRFWLARYPNCIGWIHRELQDFDHATGHDLRGVDVAREDSLSEVEANSLINLGQDFLHRGLTEESLSAFHKVREIADRDTWMSWRYNIRLEAAKSEYWLARGDLRRAEEYARQLFEVATQHNCRKYIAVAHKLLAEIFIARSDLAEAEKELQAALDLLRKYPVPVEAWKTYAALGRLHLRSGNSHLARESFAQADELIRQIAARVDDEKLRAVFLNSAAVREIRDGMVSDFEPGS